MKQKAAFIDRDGTLVEEVNYLSRVEDLRLYSYTEKALSLLKENNYLILVVTNQSGIGRQIYSESDMHRIHEEMQKQLYGIIDGFFFCPHLPCDGCICRKPNLGMIEAAQGGFEIDMENSWMIGDKKIDVETGRNANIKTAMVMTGYGLKHSNLLDFSPDIMADDLLSAVNEIYKFSKISVS